VLFVDVDECNSTETDNCPADTVCVNTYGTYFCVSGVTLGHCLSQSFVSFRCSLATAACWFCMYLLLLCGEKGRRHQRSVVEPNDFLAVGPVLRILSQLNVEGLSVAKRSINRDMRERQRRRIYSMKRMMTQSYMAWIYSDCSTREIIIINNAVWSVAKIAPVVTVRNNIMICVL